jgi:hypothetical protein
VRLSSALVLALVVLPEDAQDEPDAARSPGRLGVLCEQKWDIFIALELMQREFHRARELSSLIKAYPAAPERQLG